MLDTNIFGNELKKYGFDFFSGVPCSFLKDLINYAINDCNYIMAANEGDAVAICSGAYTGCKKSVVLMQNSGLTNAVSPLTSLNYIFRIPVLGFVSLRGESGISDEPQHDLMGRITEKMLDLMEIEWEYLSENLEIALKQIKIANNFIEENKSFFFIVKKGTFANVELKEQSKKYTDSRNISEKNGESEKTSRIQVLEVLSKLQNSEIFLLATTGFTGRELYEIEDSVNNFYMVGSMGCISSFGLGLSIVKPDKKFIIIDGDGSLIMRMGSMLTNSYYKPDNMYHLLLDNNMHNSTGGQITVSNNSDFVKIASASGYPEAKYIHNLNELEESIKNWLENPALTFAYLKISDKTKKDLGRPKIKPYEVKERFMKELSNK